MTNLIKTLKKSAKRILTKVKFIIKESHQNRKYL